MCRGCVPAARNTKRHAESTQKWSYSREARQVLNASATAAGLKRKETLCKEASCLVVTDD